MAVAVLPQLGTRQLMATLGWQQWVNSWSEAVELVLVCGSGMGVGGAVLLGNVEL